MLLHILNLFKVWNIYFIIRGQFPTLRCLVLLLSLIVALYTFQIIINKLGIWKSSKNQVSMINPDGHKVNNVALNPKVINFKSLCLVITFSGGYFFLYYFYGSTNWYRSLIKSSLNRLLFTFSVQSFIYLQNHKLRKFVKEEMIYPILINPFNLGRLLL